VLELYKVALTGPIAAGKTTALRYFEELGAFCVSADRIVHQLLSPQSDLTEQIVRLLGNKVLINGELSRAEIAKCVFEDPLLLKEYESLLHPRVQQEILHLFEEKKSMYPLLVAEIPLLFEASMETSFDATILLTADHRLRKERFSRGDQGRERDFERREKHFLPEKEKKRKASFTLNNSGSEQELYKNIKTLYNTLLRKTL
jgi:dephospho-CoA kinase